MCCGWGVSSDVCLGGEVVWCVCVCVCIRGKGVARGGGIVYRVLEGRRGGTGGGYRVSCVWGGKGWPRGVVPARQ